MRCHKHDENGSGCRNQTGHRGKCKIRPNPDSPQPADWPCAEAGCLRRVKHEGSRCHLHRHRPAGAGPGDAPHRRPIPSDPREPGLPALPGYGPMAKPHKAGIIALEAADIIANKAARKALVGLARTILKTYEDLDAEKARRREQIGREERRMA